MTFAQALIFPVALQFSHISTFAPVYEITVSQNAGLHYSSHETFERQFGGGGSLTDERIQLFANELKAISQHTRLGGRTLPKVELGIGPNELFKITLVAPHSNRSRDLKIWMAKTTRLLLRKYPHFSKTAPLLPIDFVAFKIPSSANTSFDDDWTLFEILKLQAQKRLHVPLDDKAWLDQELKMIGLRLKHVSEGQVERIRNTLHRELNCEQALLKPSA